MAQGRDLALLKDAARGAGDIARRYFRRDPEAWAKPGGAGPVTEADLAVDKILREELTGARPDYGWLSEETPDSPARLERDRLFIVDPIDGTRAFIDGDPTWAISLAVAERGRVTSAVVYLPARDKLYAAEAGHGAWLGERRIRASARDALEGATVLAARPTFEPFHWKDATPPPVDRQFRSSLAYRLSLTGEGRFDAMLTLRATWEWDIAAGSLIVAEAGGVATDRRLVPLAFNNPGAQVNGVVAAGARLHPLLGARLSAA
ncbi:MAG TPA: 3'(2'),5'-bisphosphate nucleotidase CysQ [Aliiroseovarius sp.]|nr:3'(2'),5'-bisphosphate nucleotidase CysQ [Aliiroseovarius sp.]